MRICILGAGSLGSTIGGAFAAAGNEVHLVGREAHMNEVNRNGLAMVSTDGENVVRLQGHCSPDGIGEADLVIVLCKSFDTEAVFEHALGLIGPGTVVLSLQNGLGNEEALRHIVGVDHVIGGKTYIGGMMLGPGRVQATIAGKKTVIGELDGSSSERVKNIAAAFEDAGMTCEASDNIMGVIWDKLLVNVATGAVCGVTGLPYGEMYRDEGLVATAIAAVSEGMAVARAAGVVLSFDDASESLELARRGLPPDFKPSILQSLEKRRPTEVGVINGAVAAEGRALGIPTPVNETLTACVRGIERFNLMNAPA